MTPVSSWRWLWRYLVAAGVLGLLGVRYYGQDAPLLPLNIVELGLHEASHLLFIWAPTMVHVLAGSVGQVLIPLLIGIHLMRRAHDPLGGAVGLGWAGLSMHGVAVYAADAPTEELPLVGGGLHDWAYILGPEGLDRMHEAAAVADALRGVGAALVAVAVLWCVAVPVLIATGRLRLRASQPADDPLPEWLGPPAVDPNAPTAAADGADVAVFPGVRRPEYELFTDEPGPPELTPPRI